MNATPEFTYSSRLRRCSPLLILLLLVPPVSRAQNSRTSEPCRLLREQCFAETKVALRPLLKKQPINCSLRAMLGIAQQGQIRGITHFAAPAQSRFTICCCFITTRRRFQRILRIMGNRRRRRFMRQDALFNLNLRIHLPAAFYVCVAASRRFKGRG